MKRTISILYIGNKLASSGSTATSIETLGGFLLDEGYTVITSSSKKNKFCRVFDMAFTVIKFRKKVSLVLIDTYSTQNFYYAVLVASMCRLFELDYVPILRGGNLPNRLIRSKRLSQKLFSKAKTNVAPSQYLMSSFKNNGFYNLTYIPNTIALNNYPFKLRKAIKPKLLWVRSFAEIYNPLLALEIVEGLKKLNIDVELCMVGPEKDGSLQNCKKIATERNLPITFTGILTKAEWIALSQNYDIFINTTNFDNMPVSVMEAMALGLPIVSTNVGGVPFLVDTDINGVLIPPNNPKAFINVIINLCENPSRSEKLSLNGRAKVENFDWQVVKKQWFELFSS